MRDFAPKNHNKHKHRAQSWIINLFLIGLVGFGGYLITSAILKRYHTQKARPQQHAKPIAHVVKKKAFDFYSILPNMSVPTAPSTVSNQAFNKSAFYLQVAVTTSKTGARRLIEKLGTEGYSALQQIMPNRKKVTYKILIGPFSNKKDAQVNQTLLANNKINSLVIKPQQTI